MEKLNGYRGIWYYNQPTGDRYVYKYSGGRRLPTEMKGDFAAPQEAL